MDILFLEPIFKERIWGGQRLTEFGYQLPFRNTGECWAISAHENGDSIIKNGNFKGMTLSAVFKEHKSLFNHDDSDVFPLLTKILDANDDLSVQVHPQDHVGNDNQLVSGKTECWYILDAKEESFIIYGHRAKNQIEFETMIKENRWEDLLIKKYVQKGDFVYVPAGTVHAIGKGLLILETQQSSDLTYRLYDYHRLDDKGKPRELHIEQSIQVTNIPNVETSLTYQIEQIGKSIKTTFIKNDFFTVQLWNIKGIYQSINNHYRLISVIEGNGFINGISISKGDHFIVCSNVNEMIIEGDLDLIVSWS
jgi:mannose-6-phosphate isomerase